MVRPERHGPLLADTFPAVVLVPVHAQRDGVLPAPVPVLRQGQGEDVVVDDHLQPSGRVAHGVGLVGAGMHRS